MSLGRALTLLLLLSFPIVSGCGGGGGDDRAPTTAQAGLSITISPDTDPDIITNEKGTATATISVRLNTKPSASVTIPVNSSDTTEGVVSTEQLVFTTANWATAQTITVSGVVDDINDGNQIYTVHLGPSSSDDKAYKDLEKTISGVNNDERFGYVDLPPLTYISGYTTDESGQQVSFEVKLHTKPNADVIIPISSSDEGEGIVSPTQLTFTTTNWDTPQIVTVTGVEDPEAGDNPAYTILLGLTVSTDEVYQNLDPTDIGLTNIDVKTGVVEVSPLSLSTTEAGTKGYFQVRLGTVPFFEVTIPVRSADTSEGTVDKASLTFDSSNWNHYQTVTVTGVSDNLADGDITYNIELGATTSADDNYNALNPNDVAVTNQDVRSAGFVVTPTDIITDEAGGRATFTVKLASQPTQNVTIGLRSDNENEGTVSPSQLTFTNANWNDPQEVTVTGVSDIYYDPDQAYNIILDQASSADTLYNGQEPPDVTAINQDRKLGSVTMQPVDPLRVSLTTDESGYSDEFQVSLNRQPGANITIELNSSNLNEGTVSPSTLTFTKTDWAPKKVTVSGVDDAIADGNQAYYVTGTISTLGDNNFDGLPPVSISVTNIDIVDPYGVAPSISAGSYHNLVLASDGTVWGWGACADGQLDAIAPATCSGAYTLPLRLNIDRAKAVSAGDSFSVIVKNDGSVWSSGLNDHDQLGHPGGLSLAQVYGPSGIGSNLTDVKAVSTGSAHVLALKNDGTVWAWGNGLMGQLGNGATTNSQVPVQAVGDISGKTITAVAAGSEHSLALGSDQYVYTWGSNVRSQLGLVTVNATTPAENKSTPTAVINLTSKALTSVTAIAAGQYHSFAVGKYNNSATGTFGWGFNNDYQTGSARNADYKTYEPTVVTGTSITASRLDGGYLHSLAVVPGSPTRVYSWGDNEWNLEPTLEIDDNRGALGTGNTTDTIQPTSSFTAVASTVTDVNAGYNYSLVLLSDGRIQASGVNSNAQLGTNEIDISGTNNYTATPTYVEDPGDGGKGTSIYFYSYRPILSGQPATSTPRTDATITVCSSSLAAPANCGPITYYRYSLDGVFWSDAFPISKTIDLSGLSGTVNIWVKGMTSSASEIQTFASPAKVSWEVTAP